MVASVVTKQCGSLSCSWWSAWTDLRERHCTPQQALRFLTHPACCVQHEAIMSSNQYSSSGVTWCLWQKTVVDLCVCICTVLYSYSAILKISAGPSHSGSKTFSRGISYGISRVIATLIMNSPRNCPTPLNTLAYFLIRSPALCQLRWNNSHFHYQFDQFNIQPAQGLSSGDAAVCTEWNLWCFTSYLIES